MTMPAESYTDDELAALDELGGHTRRDVTHLIDVCQLSLREFVEDKSTTKGDT